MRFEDVLPKMRDGRIAELNGTKYRFSDEKLHKWISREEKWVGMQVSDLWFKTAIKTTCWKFPQEIVKRWQWVFGSGSEKKENACGYYTEIEAEGLRIKYGFEWKHRIDETEIDT